ncbi:MAG: hypothetical protein ABIA62_02010 [Candidatus Woesearchaeota archaeon]
MNLIQKIKIEYLIPIVISIGIAVLFFFPEPETNLFAYIGTAASFAVLTIGLIVWQRKKGKKGICLTL